MKSLIIISITLISTSLFAQEAQSKINLAEEMKYFSFLEGEWEGIALNFRQGGQVDTIYQHEDVEYELGETLLVIEGEGKDSKEEVVFNAFGVIHYDLATQSFKMMAFKDDGAKTLADIKIVGEGNFEWSFSPNAYANIKYELQINEEGKWIEKGYFSPDKQKWIPFFSMELSKVEEETE